MGWTISGMKICCQSPDFKLEYLNNVFFCFFFFFTNDSLEFLFYSTQNAHFFSLNVRRLLNLSVHPEPHWKQVIAMCMLH